MGAWSGLSYSSAVGEFGGTDRRHMTDRAFQTTVWSMVLEAQQASPGPAGSAMAKLCETYWFPLYSYIRYKGKSEHDAQDLTQEFFAVFLEKNYLKDVHREKGRFRSFLLASLRHFMADEWDKANAKKRGGGVVMVSLDFERAENLFIQLPSKDLTPEELYDRNWASTVLSVCLPRLRKQYVSAGQEERFQVLKQVISTDKERIGYAELGKTLGISEGAAKVAVHRLRRRYRDLIREEIANTLADANDTDTELAFLMGTKRA